MSYSFKTSLRMTCLGSLLIISRFCPAVNVRLSNLTNVQIVAVSTNVDVTGDVQNICAYVDSSKRSPRYNITINSSNGSGTLFRLSNGAGGFVKYELDWYQRRRLRGTITSMQNGVEHKNFRRATNDDYTDDCDGATPRATSASFEIMVRAADLQSAVAGHYTDTLTIIMSSDETS